MATLKDFESALEKNEEKIVEVIKTSTEKFISDLETAWKTYIYESFSILYPRWFPLDFTPAPVAVTHFIDNVSTAFSNFSQGIVGTVALIISDGLLDTFLPVPEDFRWRVIPLDRAVREIPKEIIELFIGSFAALPNVPSASVRIAGKIANNTAIAVAASEATGEGFLKALKAVGRGVVVSRLKVLVIPICGAVAAVLVINAVLTYAKKISSADAEALGALTQKNPFVRRNQPKHRVRVSPKLSTR